MPPIIPRPQESGCAGYILGTYREKLDVSQAAFASAAGLTWEQVARFERGEPVDHRPLVLSRYLQCLAAGVLSGRKGMTHRREHPTG